MTVTNQNFIQEEIKRRLNSGNACYHSAHKLLSSCLKSKMVIMTTYQTITSPASLYGCETWSLILREGIQTEVFENSVLRKTFGLKRAEGTKRWRKLHNKELHDLYSLPSIIIIIKSRRLRWVGHVARMGQNRSVYRLLVAKPEGKRIPGRQRCRWVDNIKMDLVGRGWGGVG
jgi:hypothetical protein